MLNLKYCRKAVSRGVLSRGYKAKTDRFGYKSLPVLSDGMYGVIAGLCYTYNVPITNVTRVLSFDVVHLSTRSFEYLVCCKARLFYVYLKRDITKSLTKFSTVINL